MDYGTLFVALSGLAIGYAVGDTMRGRLNKHSELPAGKLPPVSFQVKPVAPEQVVETGTVVEPAAQPAADARAFAEVAGVYREPDSGSLAVEMEGSFIWNVNDLDLVKRDRLTRAAEDLLAWVGQPRSPRPTPIAEETFSTSLPVSTNIPAPTDVSMPSYKLVDVLARAIKPDASKAAAQPKSIAAQVDEILQEKIMGGPLEKRGVRLMDSPTHGIWVWVAMDKYDGVDAVPDEEIRQVIHAAVAEWTSRSLKA